MEEKSRILLALLAIVSILYFLPTDLLARRGYQGCCSHHGGVAYCDSSTGRIVCNDGTYSPTCRCYVENEPNTYTPRETPSTKSPSYTPSTNTNTASNYSSRTYTKSDKDEEYEKCRLLLFDLKAGYEWYFMNVETEPHYNSYSEIKIDVKPIELAYVELNASIPFIFFRTLFKYKIHERGGFVKENRENEVKELTDDKRLQYLMNYAAGIMGFELSYTKEHFNYGEMEYYTGVEGNEEARTDYMGSTYFQVEKNQIDVRYHVTWWGISRLGGIKEDEISWDFYFGYRYLDYQLPGIVYTFSDTSIGPCGESYPQLIDYKIHMGGIGINNNLKEIKPGLNFFIGLEVYAGAGATYVDLNSYRYNVDQYPADYDPADDAGSKLFVSMWELGGNLGLLLNLTNSVLITSIKAEYNFGLYGKYLGNDWLKDKDYEQYPENEEYSYRQFDYET